MYEDKYCLIVNKPENILVHHSYYARNIKDKSLLEILREQIIAKVYPVHRLDRKTCGLILLIKDKKYVKYFQNLFDTNKITKKYKALVRGYTNQQGRIDSPIKNNETKVYKDALTLYKLLETYELKIPVTPYKTSRYSLLQLELKTGRTHQIRKHLNKIAHPIIGDHKYGNRHHNQMFEKVFEVDNLFLQAYYLKFPHPILSKSICIEITLPTFWNNTLNKMQKKTYKCN